MATYKIVPGMLTSVQVKASPSENVGPGAAELDPVEFAVDDVTVTDQVVIWPSGRTEVYGRI